jgi:N utilization substance protein B
MAGRSEARRFVLQMLYLVDQNPDADRDRIHVQLRKEFTDDTLREFAWSLFIGVLKHRDEMDTVISKTASNWRLERMAATDRNVLRLGMFEMTQMGTPAAVVIDEAIEIAREFGTENSPSFVNGILDKLIPAQPAASSPAEK